MFRMTKHPQLLSCQLKFYVERPSVIISHTIKKNLPKYHHINLMGISQRQTLHFYLQTDIHLDHLDIFMNMLTINFLVLPAGGTTFIEYLADNKFHNILGTEM